MGTDTPRVELFRRRRITLGGFDVLSELSKGSTEITRERAAAMFVTSPEMRHELTSALFPGQDVWDLVLVPLAVPLVIVQVRLGRSKRNRNRTTYLCKIGHLAALAVDRNDSIISADVLLPPRTTASKRWELDPIQELRQCEEPSNPALHSWVLRTPNREHVDSICGTTAEGLKNRMLLYRLKGADCRRLCAE